jgi:NAD(P)-dependent dehydrogenase (short-subunit alcohol dehydrogenase family)
MDLNLAGKHVVITGGSGGIGRGLVAEFAREGANVTSVDRDPGDRLVAMASAEALPGVVFPVTGDITSKEGAEAAFVAARERFGPVDVLINNAGGAQPPGPLETFSEEYRRWEIALNIDGTVNCVQAAARDMLARGSGSIVNISSHAALLGEAADNMVHYGAVKGFVASFSKGLAWEWGPKGVRVNTIAPGWIVPHSDEHVGGSSFWTRFGFDMMGRPAEMQAALEQGTLFNMSNLPICRLGRPEDIARLAMFLASDRASYITGQLISCGGGAYMP